MQLIKEQSFTDRIFLEVLDHGFQPQKAPTTFQRRSTVFMSLHWQYFRLCKCACSILIFTKNHQNLEMYLWTVFPLSRFLFSEAAICRCKGEYFWQYSKHSFKKLDKFVEIWHLVYFDTELVWNLMYINVFLGL